jgi:hypothetical protein
LELIKICGVKNIHYSTDGGEMINERAKDMTSIQVPHSKINAPDVHAKNAFYDTLIIKKFPAVMKRENFKHFADHNLKNIFPQAIINYMTGEAVINGQIYCCHLL